MATTKPTITANWADNYIPEQTNQSAQVVSNRQQPPVDIQEKGLAPDQPMARQWFNHQLWLLNQWAMYLEEQQTDLEARVAALEILNPQGGL